MTFNEVNSPSHTSLFFQMGVSPSLQAWKGWKWMCESLSRVRLFETPWTAAHQAPLSMEFPRHKYWSLLPFPSPGDLPDPGIKPCLPPCRQILYHLCYQGCLWKGWGRGVSEMIPRPGKLQWSSLGQQRHEWVGLSPLSAQRHEGEGSEWRGDWVGVFSKICPCPMDWVFFLYLEKNYFFEKIYSLLKILWSE